MLKPSFIALALAVVFTGCATAQNVVPLPGGQYETTGTGESKADALKSALSAAESTCKPRNLRHVVQSQAESYKGILSESTNKKTEAAAQVLAVLSNSWIPTLSGDDDYSVKLTFTCEP